MTSTVLFVDLVTRQVRAALTGSAAPVVRVSLNTYLKAEVKFFEDGVVEALADDTPVTLVVKRRLGHDEAAVGLDVSATVTGTGEERVYTLQALVTGEALATALEGMDEGEFALQVAWGTEGAVDYAMTEPLWITVVNAYVRPGDELPDPLSDAAWEVFKSRLVAGDGVTLEIDEVERTVTIVADVVSGWTVDGDYLITVIDGVTYEVPKVARA